MAPRELTPPLHSLPPILDNESRTPISSCSKGSRGLSVQPRVLGIFTETTVSPGPSKRQCPSRYAIRAGRNLPDKEFRWSLIRTCLVETSLNGIALPLMRLPACRHAVGTISSPCVQGIRRMVSEDSDQFVPGFTPVHRLHDLSDLRKPFSGLVLTAGHRSTQEANFSKSTRFADRSGYSRKNGIIRSSRSCRR